MLDEELLDSAMLDEDLLTSGSAHIGPDPMRSTIIENNTPDPTRSTIQEAS